MTNREIANKLQTLRWARKKAATLPPDGESRTREWLHAQTLRVYQIDVRIIELEAERRRRLEGRKSYVW